MFFTFICCTSTYISSNNKIAFFLSFLYISSTALTLLVNEMIFFDWLALTLLEKKK
jgi:hypothetical protein